MKLLELYRLRNHEIDVLASRNALFVLGFIDHVSAIAKRDLIHELGWSQAQTEATLGMLKAGGFVRPTSAIDSGPLGVTAEGKRLLKSAGLSAEAASDRGDGSPLQALAPAIPLVVGVGILLIKRALKRDRVSSFVLGLGAGLAVGVLFAPKSGEETRNLIKDGASEGSEYLKERGTEFIQTAAEWVDKGREAVDRQREALSEAVEAGRQATEERAHSG